MASDDDGEKTEDATPKKLEEARSKGQVALSNEFVASAMLAAMIGAMLVFGSRLMSSIGTLFVNGSKRASELSLAELTPGDFSILLIRSAEGVAVSLAILVTPTIFMGFLTSYTQVGFKMTPKALNIELSKLNPISNMKKVFGPRGIMRTGLGILKIAAIGTVVAMVTWSQLPAITLAAGTDAPTMAMAIGRVILRAVSAGVAVVMAISLIDLIYQRMQHAKDMRMSKKEIKDESKNAEGDPQVKARIRQVQREISQRRMMSDVPDATAVIMNPTHYAVALRYEDGRDAAPRVVAKGLDEVALRIRAVAEEHGVVVIEEPPLARALHRACDIGDHVPEELFEAVAKVLAYVYRMEGRGQAAAATA